MRPRPLLFSRGSRRAKNMNTSSAGAARWLTASVPALGLVLLLGLFGMSCSCNPKSPGNHEAVTDDPAWFEDVTDRVGLNFVHDAGPTGTYFTPQSMGSGC